MQISSDEINRLLALAPQSRTQVKGAVNASSLGESVAVGGAAATLDVSTASQDIQHVQKVLSRLPDVREDRVSALKSAIDRTAVSAYLLSELRDKRSLVYDVQVNETSVEGDKSFVVVSAHTHRDSADQVKQIVREVLEGKLEAVHVTVAI